VSAIIGASHVLCAIGSGTEQVWAAARAGIARIASSHVMNRHFEPIQMGLVPEDALGELTPEIDKLPLPPRARRMLRLAAPSFRSVAAGVEGEVPVFIGLPQLTDREAPWMKHVPGYLQVLTGAKVDRARSVVVPQGRAAALIALERALQFLESDPEADVIVGGVDSFLDLRLLANLDAEERILGPRVMDGFIPGEGAAFYRLTGSNVSAAANGKQVIVPAAASTRDSGHRYGNETSKGEGLAVAMADMRGRMPAQPPIATTFAGFNGEHFDAKLWGVARLRHNDLFAPAMVIEHPADKFGDPGAAMGAMLVALAGKSLTTGTRSGPALVWAASDHEPRACAVVSVANA
jgi:3-oxoacyl-[acyl-carrier-protein] synthase-1